MFNYDFEESEVSEVAENEDEEEKEEISKEERDFLECREVLKTMISKVVITVLEVPKFSIQKHEEILNYISTILSLFDSVSKGRNDKSSQKIISILGLNQEFVEFCLRSKFLHKNLQKGFIILYSSLFLDVSPFQPLSNHFTKNII